MLFQHFISHFLHLISFSNLVLSNLHGKWKRGFEKSKVASNQTSFAKKAERNNGVSTYYSHPGITGNSCWKIKWFVQFFNSFLVFSADLDMLSGGLFSHNVNLYSFMFLHKIFTRVVCVNGGRYNFVRGFKRASRNALGQKTNVYSVYRDE